MEIFRKFLTKTPEYSFKKRLLPFKKKNLVEEVWCFSKKTHLENLQ